MIDPERAPRPADCLAERPPGSRRSSSQFPLFCILQISFCMNRISLLPRKAYRCDRFANKGAVHMKAMVEGVWRTDVEPTSAYRAAAERSRFRGWVRADGNSDFAPEPGRYHLYVSYACPSRIGPARARAAGSGGGVSISVLDPDWGGPWAGCSACPRPPRITSTAWPPAEVYRKANARFTGKVTVPALWDKSARPSSTTNRPRSCACSRSSSARSPPPGSICTPRRCVPRSTR